MCWVRGRRRWLTRGVVADGMRPSGWRGRSPLFPVEKWPTARGVGGMPITVRHAGAAAESGTRALGGKCDTAPSGAGGMIRWDMLSTRCTPQAFMSQTYPPIGYGSLGARRRAMLLGWLAEHRCHAPGGGHESHAETGVSGDPRLGDPRGVPAHGL